MPSTTAPQIPRFDDLGLDDDLLDALDALDYDRPTEVQALTIPPILDGDDVIACAPTGTGKTAAFVLPTIQRIAGKPGLRALVLSPTRELAIQIYEAARRYSRYSRTMCGIYYGGMPLVEQEAQLSLDPNFVVATPGRLLDFLHRRTFDLQDVEVVVLDEADRMLDMGFLPDIEEILMMSPPGRQTLLFSATMPPEIARLAERTTRSAVRIRVRPRDISERSAIRHRIFPVEGSRKNDLFLELIQSRDIRSAVVFVRTRDRVEEVGRLLARHRFRPGRLHSDRSQEEREETLRHFREGRFRILVATDVASRGLDINHISHVINYDVPLEPDDYVHRAGRTGRMDKQGESLTLVTPREASLVARIEKYAGCRLPVEIHPEFGLRGPLRAHSRPSGGSRRR